MPGTADGIESPANALVGSMQQPAGKVTTVDVLNRLISRSGRKDVAAALDPPQPPWHPADVLIRAENQAGTRQHGLVSESLDGRQLAAPLRGCVVFPRFAFRVCVHHWARFIQPNRYWPAVDRAAGHIAIMTGSAGQQLRRFEHHLGRMAP